MTEGIKGTGEGYFTSGGRIKTDSLKAIQDAQKQPAQGSGEAVQVNISATLRPIGGTYQNSILRSGSSTPTPTPAEPPQQSTGDQPASTAPPPSQGVGSGNGRSKDKSTRGIGRARR